jgi:hypothetical protein
VYVVTSGAQAGVWWLHPQGKTLPVSAPPPVEPTLATVPISSCQVLDRSNTVYEVTQDLKPLGAGSCLLFPQEVKNVTVDGKGHSVAFGSPAIFGDDLENIVVKDLVLSQLSEDGPGEGAVRFSNVRGLKVLGITITTNPALREEDGVVVTGVLSRDVEVSGNTISVGRFATGIAASAEGLVVRDNRITAGPPGGHGIRVAASPAAVISNNQVSAGGSGAPATPWSPAT